MNCNTQVDMSLPRLGLVSASCHHSIDQLGSSWHQPLTNVSAKALVVFSWFSKWCWNSALLGAAFDWEWLFLELYLYIGTRRPLNMFFPINLWFYVVFCFFRPGLLQANSIQHEGHLFGHFICWDAFEAAEEPQMFLEKLQSVTIQSRFWSTVVGWLCTMTIWCVFVGSSCLNAFSFDLWMVPGSFRPFKQKSVLLALKEHRLIFVGSLGLQQN